MDYFANFTEGEKKALGLAGKSAQALGNNYIGTEHLLEGILAEEGRAAELLNEQGITEENVRDMILRLVGKGDFVFNQNFGYTPRTKKILELSRMIAAAAGQQLCGQRTHALRAYARTGMRGQPHYA